MNDVTFTFEPHPAEGYVHIRVRGRVTAPETRTARSGVVTAHPHLNRLWDFREADLTAWTADDMRMFIDVVTRRDPDAPLVRVAALVSREVDYGLARLFEQISSGTMPIEGGVFRDEAQAIEWVRTPG